MRVPFFVLSFLLTFGIIYGQNQQQADSLIISPFSMVSDSAVTYKAAIKLPGRTLTGLLIVKRIDMLSYQTAFISELGMSLFELDLQPDSYHIVSNLETLNKHDVIQILAKQVYLVVHPFTEKSKPGESVKRTIISYNFANLGYKCRLDSFYRVSSATTGKHLSKIRIIYSYSNKHLPVNIRLKQSGIRIKWNLQLLEQP